MTPVTTSRTTAGIRPRRAITVLLAVAVAVLAWGIATLLLGVDLTVDINNAQPAMTIGLGPVVVTALIASLAGWASLAGLERVTDKARGIWRVVAVAVLLASFLPLLAAETDLAVTLTLGAMHVLVAAVLIPGLTASNERTNP